jgi:4-amino-4-deoxy-L-arabinose transferase-like glycosyltransferase
MSGYQYWLPEVRSFGVDYPFDPRSQRDGSGIVADSLDGALLAWVCPCPEDDPLTAFPSILFYPLVLLGMFWIFTPPLATVPGLIEVWKRRREPGPGFVFWLTALTVLFYLVYFYVGARFMAGPATLLTIYSGVAMARWAERFAGQVPASTAVEEAPDGERVPAGVSAATPAGARTQVGWLPRARQGITETVARLGRVDLAILGSLAILAALPRMTNLLGLDPFIDEVAWTDWVVQQFDPLIPHTWFAPLLTDGRPPLHFWLALPISAVIGNGFVATRLAAALAGVASTLVLYGLGKELTGSRTTAAVAAILWALTPFSVFFARVAADDALLALTAMLAVWSSVRLARQPTRTNGILCGVALGLGVLAKTTGVLFGAAPLLAILVVGRPRDWAAYIRPLLATAVTGLVTVIPLLIWLPQVVAQVLLHTGPVGGDPSGQSLLAINTRLSVDWSQRLLGAGFLCLAAVGLVLAILSRQRPLLFAALISVVWLVVLLSRTSPVFSRYLLFAAFPAYLLAGYAVDRLAAWVALCLGRVSGGKSTVWTQAAVRVVVIVAGLAVAVGPHAALLRDVVFDPVHAALPESEHFRYVEQWYALYGLGEVADELRRRGRNTPVTVLVPVASREERVLLPHSAIRSYLRRDPAVRFVEVPALYRAQDLREIRRLAQNRPTYLLVNGTYVDMPGTANDAPAYTRRIEERLERDVPAAREVLRIPRPNTPSWLSLYRLDGGD